MRRAFAALILCVFLTGCGASGDAALEGLREELSAADEVRLTALVCSAEGSRRSEFTLECVASGGECALTVLSPEELAGVTARFGADGPTLSYDTLALEFTEPEGVTPVTALPLLLGALESAYVTLSWTEDGDTFVSLEATDDLSLTVRLDTGGVPVWAELLEAGETAAQCEITEFTID